MGQPESSSYIIRGGETGRARLRLLSRVMWPTTEALFRRVGIRRDAICLDVGCGGGDVTVELRRLAADGAATGIDVDEDQLDQARAEASAAGLLDIEFRYEDVTQPAPAGELARYDVVYVRFVLTHLTDPAAAIGHLAARLVPGGVLIVEDLDFRGHFCHPECAAFERYVDLFSRAARARGADPDIGPRLPFLLRDAGLQDTSMKIVQPAGFEGEVKLLAPITLEAIGDSVVEAGLATEREIDDTFVELSAFADRDDTILSLPRIVQTWGSRPEATFVRDRATDIETAAEWVRNASRITVLTGAGISTDSGIPDFRGPQGVWTKNPAAEKTSTLANYLAEPEVRRTAWQFRLNSPGWTAQPNAGHLAIVELERQGKLHALVTQNIDELHRRAGNDAARVIEVHGTMWWTRCWTCGDRRPMAETLDRVRAGEDDPDCLVCRAAGRSGILKSDTISFGQALVPEVIDRAMEASASCDLLLAIGSTLSVYPAAACVPVAARAGARVVIVNGGPTDMDTVADIVLNGQISEILPALVGAAPVTGGTVPA